MVGYILTFYRSNTLASGHLSYDTLHPATLRFVSLDYWHM
jgi:hypothetical protein